MTALAAENLDQDAPDAPVSVNNVKSEALRSVIERIERLVERKEGITADIKLVKAEAKSEGFDIKTINELLKLRKKDATTLEQEELLLEVYKRALGMTD